MVARMLNAGGLPRVTPISETNEGGRAICHLFFVRYDAVAALLTAVIRRVLCNQGSEMPWARS